MHVVIIEYRLVFVTAYSTLLKFYPQAYAICRKCPCALNGQAAGIWRRFTTQVRQPGGKHSTGSVPYFTAHSVESAPEDPRTVQVRNCNVWDDYVIRVNCLTDRAKIFPQLNGKRSKHTPRDHPLTPTCSFYFLPTATQPIFSNHYSQPPR